MKTNREFFDRLILLLVAIVCAPLPLSAVGTWTRLNRTAPESVELMLLMPDGTVMAASQGGASSGQGWFKLTPDSRGSYINGTWSTLASMHYDRLYYASDVLKDGRVFIAGAEYGSGTNAAEVYDPKSDTWTEVGPVVSGQVKFLDNISKMLPNGDILIAPVGPATPGGTVIFHPAANNFTAGPRLFRGFYQDEASWVKLPDDSILTIDPFGTHSERYIPSINKWVNDSDIPVQIYNSDLGEMGPGFLLPNGKAFFLGGTSHTAIYTPSGTTNMGTWGAGPDIPGGHGVSDGAGAMMINGKVLCAVGSSSNYDAPTWFYEYDYVSNSFTPANGPNGATENAPPYYTAMLDLPDGTVLMSRFSRTIYVYQPDGSPLDAGKPTITGITRNPDQSYHLTGTLLNGISEGAAYGDDIQMDSNYPLIRLRNAAGNVYYARTFNWSTSSVMTGNRPVTTEFMVPTNVPIGIYSLVAVANGISSDPVNFFVGTLAITTQPQDLTVLQDQPAAFTVGVGGDEPISYQWRKDGTDIPGATTSSLLIFARLTDAGGYSAFVTNVTGSVTSSVATLTVIPTVPIPYALNNSNLLWSSAINPVWYGQTNISHDGIAAAQTFLATNGQQAVLQTTVTGPGTLRFWCKVSSETNSDFLIFNVNGTNRLNLSGEVDWEQHSFFLPAGQIEVAWVYSKDASGSSGQDAAWLDQVSFVSGGTGPFIAAQPADQTSLGGAPVAFSVTADGTPALAYQWRFNNTPIPGATNNALPLLAPTTADNGAYSVLITNAYGFVVSSNALLAVVPILVIGDDSVGQHNVPGTTTNAIAIAAGNWHNLALRADATVVAWGDDNSGQCDMPTNLTGVVAIAAGGYHSLALKANGAVVGWGADSDGQASPPAGLANVTSVAAGTWHSLALLADGTVRGWGDNSSGQRDAPSDLSSVVAIAARGNHSLALRSDGTVVAWGENINSQGSYVGQSVVPATLAETTAIGAGDYHSLAARSDGTIATWGDDSLGQIDAPADLSGVTTLAGGGDHTLALKANHSVAAWGGNIFGECNIPSLTNVIGIAAGSAHSLLLLGTPPSNPLLVNPTHAAGQFSVFVQTFSGKDYSLEYKDSLDAATWTSLLVVHGNGALQLLTDPNATVAHRFYRARQF